MLRTPPLHTQVITAEPSQLESVKQDIKSKKGIEHKFLSFKPLVAEGSALSETSWQGILFQDNRAVGKLCSPTVSLSVALLEDPASSSPSSSTGSTAAVQQCSLAFDSWVPAGAAGSSGSQQPLRIPLDSSFQQAELSVQVIGRQRSTSFALPHRYSVHGKDLASQVQLELQRQSYVAKHQAAQRAALAKQPPASAPNAAAAVVPGARTPGLSAVTVTSGDEVERLLSVFEVGDKPAWLKSLVCKFLVAEAPAPSDPPSAQAPVPGPAAQQHVAAPSGTSTQQPHQQQQRQQQEGEGSAASSSGAAAGAASPQRKQPSGRQRRKAGSAASRALGEQQQQQQQQPAVVESPIEASSPCEASQSEAASTSSPPPGKKARKKKAKPPKALQQQELDDEPPGMGFATPAQQPGSSEPPAPQAPATAPEPPPFQGQGPSQQQRRRAPKDASWPPQAPSPTPAPTPAGKPRKVRRSPASTWGQPALPPPPGLHLAHQDADLPLPTPPQQQQHPRAGPHSEHPGGRPPPGAPPAAAAAVGLQSRWARKALGGGGRAARGLPSCAQPGGGSSSDISSEVATIGRPSSVAALSSCSSSPEPADPVETPTASSMAAARACTVAGTSPRYAPDTPEALRQLAQSLLPHEAVLQQPAGRAQAQQQRSGSTHASAFRGESRLEAAGVAPLEAPPLRAELPLSAYGSASSEVVLSPHSLPSSAPSSPISRSEALSDSQGCYPSSSTTSSQAALWDSPRRQFGMPYTFATQGWSPPPSESSTSSFQQQRGQDRQKQPPSKQLYPGRAMQSQQPPPQECGPSGASQQPNRFGLPPSGVSSPSPDRQEQLQQQAAVAALRGRPLGGSNGWQQQPQVAPPQPDHRRTFSSPTMLSIGAMGRSGSVVGAGGLYGHGSGGPPAPPPNATHPVLYQQRFQQQQQQQQQYLQMQQLQQSLMGALGRPALPAGTAQLQDGWAQPCYDPGYQQHQPWPQALGQTHWADGGRANGFGRGHGRLQGGGEMVSEQCAAGYGRPSPHQNQPLGMYQQWQPSSAPPSLAASPSVGPKALSGPMSATPPSQLSLGVGHLQLQVADSAEDGPDLERLLQAVTPVVAPSSGDLADLTLADVWQFYEEPSLFGQEVVTLGGPRGPAASYYLPYLSAVQLFAPVGPGAEPRGGPGAAVYSYPGGLDEWPEEMEMIYHWFAGGHVGERIPLQAQLDQLCRGPGGGGGEHPLLNSRVADLHPYSWFAVAWYPLYRIPEAPLDARFLTYHSLASLWELVQQAQPAADLEAPQGAAVPAGSELAGAAGQAQAACAKPACTCSPLSPFPAHAGGSGGPGMHGTAAGGASSCTPTRVCSFPGSPTCSDAGTRTTNGSARAPATCSLRSDGSQGHSEAGSARSLPGSVTPSPAVSELGDDVVYSGAAGDSSQRGSLQRGDPIRVPVVGLQWYTMARSTENWTDTLVAAQLPEDMVPAVGTSLADGSHIMGCWRGVAVVAKPYPAAKGGALAWQVQQEELDETAQRLASGQGLQSRVGGGYSVPVAPQRCPDHEFFSSRAWTRHSGVAQYGGAWARGRG